MTHTMGIQWPESGDDERGGGWNRYLKCGTYSGQKYRIYWKPVKYLLEKFTASYNPGDYHWSWSFEPGDMKIMSDRMKDIPEDLNMKSIYHEMLDSKVAHVHGGMESHAKGVSVFAEPPPSLPPLWK
ncbi:hypothetical protein F5146DRAFT_1000140 [Armillaria mellea]|nr:hypothetical protein F5146DRAFT_1000140 [Armillaria mellea]